VTGDARPVRVVIGLESIIVLKTFPASDELGSGQIPPTLSEA
jgi:hypothetical protein